MNYLKSYNISEYYDKRFRDCYESNGIKQEFIMFDKPKKNYLVEHINRTVIKGATSIWLLGCPSRFVQKQLTLLYMLSIKAL